MPQGQQSREGRARWDYEYACFFAYDATENHQLISAWNEVKERVEEPFWSEATSS